jgi:hypothetical protein
MPAHQTKGIGMTLIRLTTSIRTIMLLHMQFFRLPLNPREY